MKNFNSKAFNAETFLKYLETVPRTELVRLFNSGALVNDNSFAKTLQDQVGGNYIVKPFKGRLSGSPVNYDGSTTITSGTLATYSQGIVVIGRAKAFDELDFTESITGHDFMVDVAAQLVEYWALVNEKLILSILKGIFGSAIAANIYDAGAVVSAVTLNNAMQAVAGDTKDKFAIAYMHSAVATQLENLQLLEFIKYTDDAGLQRDTRLATWNGRLVFVTDLVPTANVAAKYAPTSDVAIDPTKTYYTESGGVYTPVAEPDVSDIATYYEMTAEAYTNYTTYVLGLGAFGYGECPVKVPVEMSRDALTDGGKDYLVSRERIILAPYGVSFKASAISSKTSPSDSDLETASNWELVKDASSNAIPTKSIPFLAIVTRSN